MVGPLNSVCCDKQIGVYVRFERAVVRPVASSVWLVHGRCLQEGAVLGGRRLVANVNIDHWVVVVGWRLVGKYKWLIVPVHAIALVKFSIYFLIKIINRFLRFFRDNSNNVTKLSFVELWFL